MNKYYLLLLLLLGICTSTNLSGQQVTKPLQEEVVSLSHSEQLLAASQRAKEKIPVLYRLFSKGLNAETYLLMKFPFEYGDGKREWMWVEVSRWNKEQVIGILDNEPRAIKSLKIGMEVEKDIKDMFDYILYLPDGRQVGNETARIILQDQE